MHRPREGNFLGSAMAFEGSKRQPHEILGVKPDADLIEITVAFNRLAPRCNPQFHPGDEVAAMRFKRLREAFETMSAAQGFKPTPDPFFGDDNFHFAPPRQTAFNYRPADKHSEYAHAAELIQQRRQKTRGEEAQELLNRRVRINRLTQDWTDYCRAIGRRHETVDSLKAERGLSFTFLKSVLRRSEKDRELWNAETYLRRGHEGESGLYYNFRDFGTVMLELRHYLRANEVDRLNTALIDTLEEDLQHRRMLLNQAIAILKGKGPQP